MPKLTDALELASGTLVLEGSGAPEGSVSAPAGSLYLRSNGQTYRKGSGAGNTGWVELAGLQAKEMFWAGTGIVQTVFTAARTVTTPAIYADAGSPVVAFTYHATPASAGVALANPQAVVAGSAIRGNLTNMSTATLVTALIPQT